MALSGMHVAFCYGGGQGFAGTPLSVLGSLASSETMATPATTSIAAPPQHKTYGAPVASIRSSVDAWVSIGPAPADPAQTSTPRYFIPNGETTDLFVQPGDKVRWATA